MTTTTTPTTRGTSNSNERGSAEARRRRREWLLATYRANVDLVPLGSTIEFEGELYTASPATIIMTTVGDGVACCRCYRCGELLTLETMTVDRIIPGCKGGTYRRNNIRPACSGCNSETGGALAHRPKTKKARSTR